MKTAPAFEVALRLGAILADCDEQIHDVLRRYSESLGIAYQIRDDLDDLRSPRHEELFAGRRPSILLALAYEQATPDERQKIERLWSVATAGDACEFVRARISSAAVEAAAWRLMEVYKAQAMGSLIALKNANFKGLLRRVIGKMFNDFEIMGCCDDPRARPTPGRE